MVRCEMSCHIMPCPVMLCAVVHGVMSCLVM